MTDDDVLIQRVHDDLGQPIWASPTSRDDSPEEVWEVQKPSTHQSATMHPKKEAIDLALKWLGNTDGKIYERAKPGDEIELYIPSA
jgi:hypothetical protein